MNKDKSGIRSFFSSVKLTIFLLAVIALFAVVGTVVPQREAAAQLAQHMSPGLFSFLHKMQLFDLYHSIWFFLLMGLLSLNLLICSLDRFPMAWRRFRQQPSPQDTTVFRNLPEESVMLVRQDQKTVSEIAAEIMKSRFRNWQRVDAVDGTYLCGSKGGFSHFDVYVVHLSILVLIAGAIIGSIFGMEGYVNIIEGESINAVDLRNGKETLPLPFAVRCDKFTLELYKNGAPKTYRSDLSFIQNDQVTKKAQLLVNHPVTFEGIRFYQASYGLAPDGKASLTLFKNGKKSRDMSAGKGETLDLPGKEGQLRVLRIEENLMNMGPAVKLSINSAKGEVSFWVFQQLDKIIEANPGITEQIPMFNPGLFRPYLFVLTGMEEKYFTGLQVSRDPGIPLVALAAFLLVMGLLLVLFSSARQIWIKVDSEGSQTKISIAGRSHKNAAGLDREIQQLLALLVQRLEGAK